MRIAIIGTGNIGGAIIKGFVKGNYVKASEITCADKSTEALKRLLDFNADFKTTTDNVEAVRDADIIILAVKPWMVESVICQIKEEMVYGKQIVVSIAAGITFEKLGNWFCKESAVNNELPSIFRVIPNTAIEALSSMTFVSCMGNVDEHVQLVLDIFNSVGTTMLIDERYMGAGTALASSGIAFAFRYIRAAIEGGVELGFYPHEAQEIVLNTVKGAVELLLANGSNPEQEIDRVTTPGGITIKGLNEMELSGFSSSVIRGLRASSH
jgi:pyrroline-5-carboxylate reductase